METYFDSFHEDEHFSAISYLPNSDSAIKDQLCLLEGINADEKFQCQEESTKNQYFLGKEDFHQIMSDWQQHVGMLQPFESDDLGFNLSPSLDCNIDALNLYSNHDFFEERENSILSKALKSSSHQNGDNGETTSKFLSTDSKKELAENANCSLQFNNSQKLCGSTKTEPTIIGKVTLLNGEKEILGKNIVGLHCLNDLKENPDENCQVTSTVINGKRYKIIIKPKSLKVKELNNEKIRKSLIKKIIQCNMATNVEPKEDEIISEMSNGNYNVPILDNDMFPSWDLVNFDCEWNAQTFSEPDNVEPDNIKQPETELVKKIPPLRIKVPKLKKKKNKKSGCKSDEDVDVETVNDKVIEGKNLGSLLQNFESEIAKLQKEKSDIVTKENIKDSKKTNTVSGNSKSILPKEIIEKIAALKHKKDCRIPLIQAIPSKKAAKCSTRMQDALATMNRNKLLKIVSGGDTVSLDHDYCSIFNKNTNSLKQAKRTNYLTEKNPKKDSGMESGDVSDASEGANTPESIQNLQLNKNNNQFLQENLMNGSEVFYASNTAREQEVSEINASTPSTNNVNNSDVVKTKNVSNGNKALTNNSMKPQSNSGNSVTIHSVSRGEGYEKKLQSELTIAREKNDLLKKKESIEEKSESAEIERPKKKLKLEEYLNRRNNRENEQKNSSQNNFINESVNSNKSLNDKEASKIENNCSGGQNPDNRPTEEKKKHAETLALSEKGDKYWRERNRRSSSTSSGGRGDFRKQSKSRSRSLWRNSYNSGCAKGREGRGNHKPRWPSNRQGKLDWSSSGSRSPSRESSSSSDYSCYERRNRYRRRSKSRSLSRGRSRSGNRSFSSRCHMGKYHNNQSRKRSRSPFFAYSMREKQRQIEERRVIYVGRIEEGMTNAKLRKRFSTFGPIIDISLHFREYGDNYGFVTYAYKADAYDAVEHGNDDPSLPHYDLCFGGRRGFCKEKYADLDGMPTSYSGFNDTLAFQGSSESFDLLLKEAQAKLKNRKKQ